MMEPRKKIIGNIEFTTTPFPALDALNLQRRLLELFGPAFGGIIGSLKTSSDMASFLDTRIDGEGLSKAIAQLFQGLDEFNYNKLLKQLLSSTFAIVGESSNGQKQIVYFSDPKNYESNLTIVFQGHLNNIFALIIFVLEVNYPDFFDLVGSKLAGVLKKITKPSGELRQNVDDNLTGSGTLED
jgi:hypothetical protein